MAHEIRRLLIRREFLDAARKGRKSVTPGIVLQALKRGAPPSDENADQVGLGLTASKKVGRAVERNRARRRLRALAYEVLPDQAVGGVDYVLIARGATVTRPYDALRADLRQALKRLELYRPE
jgi:ribonuclease P protein component